MSFKYLLINISALATGLAGGYFATNYTLYAPKKVEEDVKIIHISELNQT
jgi:ABC-type branched-subunit amino acid transport system permease subunit